MAQHSKITFTTLELIVQFVKLYKDIIQDYDDRYKEIYYSRFKKVIKLGIQIAVEKRKILKRY